MIMTIPRVFISHSSKDSVPVEKLARRLANNGVDPWYAGWEIKPGDSIVQKIDEGLGGCNVFIIVVSENSVRSRWVQEELSSAQVRRIEQEARIIPVRLDDSPVPTVINHLHWVRMTPNEDDFDVLLKAIFGVSEKPPVGEIPEYVRRTQEQQDSRIQGFSQEASVVLKHLVLEVGLDEFASVSDLSEALAMNETEAHDGMEELEERELVKTIGSKTTATPTAGAYLYISSQELGFDLWRDMLAVAQCVVGHERVETSTLESDTGLPQHRIDLAALALEYLDVLKLIKVLGTAPYHFAEAWATRQTRRWLSENRSGR